jgi:hypothetical protein
MSGSRHEPTAVGYEPGTDRPYERRHHATIAVYGDLQPTAVLAAIKDAARRLGGRLAAILDRRCARLSHLSAGRDEAVLASTGFELIE